VQNLGSVLWELIDELAAKRRQTEGIVDDVSAQSDRGRSEGGRGHTGLDVGPQDSPGDEAGGTEASRHGTGRAEAGLVR
jgi:hypothetical protein